MRMSSAVSIWQGWRYVGKISRPAIIALTLITACTFQAPGPDPTGSPHLELRGELTASYPHEPKALNPYLFEGDSISNRDLLRPVLPTFTSLLPGLRARASLARRQGGDSPVWTIDSDAVWSDGRPITAEDVRFTWQAITNPSNEIADRSPYDLIEDVQVLGSKRLRVVLRGSDSPELLSEIFSAGDFVLPRHLLEGRDFGREWLDSIPVSGGPFLLEKWTRGLEFVYVPNPRWWGPPPKLARVRVQIVPSTDIAMKLLQAGRLDQVITTTRVNLSRRMKLHGADRVSSAFGRSWWEIGMNTERLDAKVREAVARTVDRSGIVEALIRREGRALNSIAPGAGGSGFGEYVKDHARAKELLAGRNRLILAYPDDDEMAQVLALPLQKAMEDVGVELELRAAPASDFYAGWRREGSFDLALWEMRAGPRGDLRGRFHSSLAAPGGSNYSRLRDAGVDSTIAAGDATPLSDALAVLPLFEAKLFIGHTDEIKGPDANATADGPLWNMELWERVR